MTELPDNCNEAKKTTWLQGHGQFFSGQRGQKVELPCSESETTRDLVYSYATNLGIVDSRQALKDLLDSLRENAPRRLVPSDISWTNFGWAAVVGCTVCSTGCHFCYAELLHDQRHEIYKRNDGLWRPDGNRMAAQYALPFSTVQLLPERLGSPLRTNKPGRVFVNASSDVFHRDVPVDFIQMMFFVMGACPHLTFQILTKRPERLVELAGRLPWFPNIHMGVTVESDQTAYRVDLLKQVPATVRWISAEPLLSSLSNLDLSGIHWVIVGGETGAKDQKIRAAHPDWFRELRDHCRQSKVAFFFKQLGSWVHDSQLEGACLVNKTRGRPIYDWPDGTRSYRFGRVRIHDRLDGAEHREFPTA